MRPYGYLNGQYSARRVRRWNCGYDDMAADPPEKGAERNFNKQLINTELTEAMTEDKQDD